MLLRLYDPILWRALKVANPRVRAQACTVLARAFPLQDPGINVDVCTYIYNMYIYVCVYIYILRAQACTVLARAFPLQDPGE